MPSDGVTLGGLATLTAIENDTLLLAHYPAIATAAGLVSAPVLRNMGTIGGNLCVDTRCTYYNQTYEWRKVDRLLHEEGRRDLLGRTLEPALLGDELLGHGAGVHRARSRVHARRARGRAPRSRRQSLPRTTASTSSTKKREEILTAIHVPPTNGTARDLSQASSTRQHRLSHRRGRRCPEDRKGRNRRGGAHRPHRGRVRSRRGRRAEALLVGKKLTDDVIEEASALAYRPAKPLDNTDLTHAYRKKMARVFVARALRELEGGA